MHKSHTLDFALGRLDREDCLDFATQTFDALRLAWVTASGPDVERWAARIADDAEGWPMHLYSQTRALLSGLVEQERPSLADVSGRTVLAEGGMRRHRYYREQVVRADMPFAVIAKVHQWLAESGEAGLPRSEVSDLVVETVDGLRGEGASDCRRFVLEFGDEVASSELCVERMLSAGVLDLDGEVCGSPIPSFSRYVERHAVKAGLSDAWDREGGGSVLRR